MRSTLMLSVMAVLLAVGSAGADPLAPLRLGRPFEGHELLQPGYPWRVPAQNGKLRVLVLAHSWTTPEFAEFCKRFDFEYDLVPIWSENWLDRSWQTDESLQVFDRISQFLENRRYDCILISSYGNLPASVWSKIYRQCVDNHTGLVLFNTGGVYSAMPAQMKGDGYLAETNKLPAIPIAGVDFTGCYEETIQTNAAGDFSGLAYTNLPIRDKVMFYQYKDLSRCVLVGWEETPYMYWAIHQGICPSGLSFPFGRVFPMADHLFAITGKAVVWAAQQAPSLRVTQVKPSGEEFTPQQRETLKYTVTIESRLSASADVVVDWEVVDEGGRRLAGGQSPAIVSAAEAGLPVELGPVPAAGQHQYFRARLLRLGNVVDWASAHNQIRYADDWQFAVGNATLNAPDKPFLTSIKLGAGDVDVVRVNLIDSWNRCVRSVEVKPAGKSLDLPVSLADTRGVSFRLQAQLWKQGKQIGQQEQFCTVRPERENRFMGIRSDPITSTVSGWYYSQLNRLYGMRFYRTPGDPPAADTMFGFAFGKYTYYGRICGPMAPDMEPTYQSFVKDDVMPLKPYGASLYDCGDDTGVGEGLFQSGAKTDEEKRKQEAQDLQRFVAYLKTVYKDARELADSWQVPLDSFEAVQRSHIVDEQKKQNMVPLLDYRQYQEFLYAQHLRRMRELVTAHTPWARITINGYSNIGNNYDLVANEVDSLVPYYSPYQLRMLRGLLGHSKDMGTVTGAYYSDETDKAFLGFIPWDTVLLGGNIVWLWGPGCFGKDGGLSYTYPIFESTRELASGIGELLATAEWDNDGVYILYSPQSVHAQEMGPRLGMAINSGDTFCTILEELQINYDFIAASRVAQGELAKRKAKALFMPYSVGLEPACQDAIRQFVKDGGIVVADFRPATRTPRGRPLPSGGLDDVFGVKSAKAKDPIGRGVIPGGYDTHVDRTTAAASAKRDGVVADTPILLRNSFGTGQTLLFNCFLGQYRTLYSNNRTEAFTDWLEKALLSVGLKGRPYGRLITGTRVFKFHRRSTTYLTLHRQDIPGTPDRTTLTLPLARKTNVYDVRAGGYLGAMENLARDVGKQEAHVLALVTDPLPPFEIAVKSSVIRPGEVVEIDVTTGKAPDDRLFRLDARNVLGNPYPITGQLLWSKNGRVPIRLATALDDPPGIYTLTITDIETGQRYTTGIRVAGAPRVEVVTK